MASVTFLGAARTVTGSKYLVELGDRRLLVDCGLFQGLKELRLRNWEPLPVDADAIHAVVLTHAHVDHSGFLPRLVAEGFRGRVFCTPGTADLCRIVLPDAGRHRRGRCARGEPARVHAAQPALPLFTEADAFRALVEPAAGRLRPAGAGDAGRRGRRSSTRATCSDRRSSMLDDRRGQRPAAPDRVQRRPRALRPARSCPIRRRWPRPTSCSSSRPTATACTSRTTTARALAAIVRETVAARRQGDHPGLCRSAAWRK